MQLLQVKCKDKLKENERRHADNWNDHFDELKATYEKEQEWNDIDNLLKYSDEQSQNENVAANNKYTQKDHLGKHHRPISTKVLNLSKVPFNNDETSVLKLGLSFTPTSPQNIPDLEYDSYQFSRKLRLTYHFRNSNFQDVSLVKRPLSFTLPQNEHQE